MKKKRWASSIRNWKDIQFEELRRQVDPAFNECHDVLSKAYYEQRSFVWKGKNWGILSKELFDKLHGLIFHLWVLEFHRANKALPVKERYPENDYDPIVDSVGKQKMTDLARKSIKQLKEEGIELEV